MSGMMKVCCHACGRDCSIDSAAYNRNPSKAHYCKACYGWPPGGQAVVAKPRGRPLPAGFSFGDMYPNGGVPGDEE